MKGRDKREVAERRRWTWPWSASQRELTGCLGQVAIGIAALVVVLLLLVPLGCSPDARVDDSAVGSNSAPASDKSSPSSTLTGSTQPQGAALTHLPPLSAVASTGKMLEETERMASPSLPQSDHRYLIDYSGQRMRFEGYVGGVLRFLEVNEGGSGTCGSVAPRVRIDPCSGTAMEEGYMKLRRHGAWLYPALLCGALLLQATTGCGSDSSGSSGGSLSAEEQINEAMKTAERARETAVAWIKAEPTMAQYSNLRWVSGGGSGLRRMEALDLPGNEPVRPWFSGPPWVLAEGTFYFQDPAKAPDSGERGWYKLTPTGLLHLAQSAQASEREQILAVLDHVRFMLWADPLWVIENMEITEYGGSLEDAQGVIGSSFAGRLPNPDTYAPELKAARTLLEGSSDTWQTPDLYGPTPGAAGATSANLEIDRQGRPTILECKGPDGLAWDWEFTRTAEEVSEPSGAADWLPSSW